MEACYRPSERVISEMIDDELIMIHLVSGNYYSLRASGAAVWQRLAAGATAAEVVRALEDRYEAPREELAESVASLLADLLAEDLVEESEVERPAEPIAEPAPGLRLAFTRPALETHTDMQDLILLDPVHEVDVRGWPYAAAVDEVA